MELRDAGSRAPADEERPPSAGSLDRTWTSLLVLALVVGTLVRVIGLDAKGLSHPEAYIPGIDLPAGISEPPRRHAFVETAVREERRMSSTQNAATLWGIDLLNVPRSDIPAVTHIDYSARVQTVHEDTNPGYYRLIEAFEAQTGCAVIVNTSFNVRGEPIVGSPQDAYRCFMRTEMDVLVLGNSVLYKERQAPVVGEPEWRNEFVLD